MELTAHALTVRGPHAPMLRPTSVTVAERRLTLVAGDPGVGHVALSLAVSGRLRPDGGEVRLDGRQVYVGGNAEAALRRRVAVVDTPGVTEPDDPLPVRTVAGEELAIAGRKAGRRAVRTWLDEQGAGEFADARFEHLPVDVRTRLVAELTAARPDVRMIVLTLPDRFGGDPRDWYDVARDLAGRGYGVLVTCSDTSARVLGVDASRFGETVQPEPVEVPATSIIAGAEYETAEADVVPAEHEGPDERRHAGSQGPDERKEGTGADGVE
jgi:energy-coupling factor transporter ATP-binding protein EcfA2